MSTNISTDNKMGTSPPSSGVRNVRDFFTRDNDKLPAELKHALTLLHLSSLDALEERFLATDGFLKPWAVFRDSIFLLQPHAMPRATSIAKSSIDKGISRTDLLWFYTQFDEGVRRYDPRANKYSVEYTTDSSVYGVIDKREWGVEAYEKHLFGWLLQALKVGKAHNPWGFDFFELRSICSAWEEVLVPIVDIVRASYNVKGRRHYGRLALFIEDRCPSGLAFPKDNVNVPEGSLMSPTPYRIVSMPKKAIGENGATFHKHTETVGVLTRKHYDETEKELRDVYPQYGGLVERPKFKVKMDEWLAEQRARAERRKVAERAGEIESFQPQVVKCDGSRSPVKQGSPIKINKRQGKDGCESPIKRSVDNIRRSLSRSISRKVPKEEPKSPLHGVTRQLYIPDNAPVPHPPLFQNPSPTDRHLSFASIESSDTTIITPWPRPETQRKLSELSIYNSIRNSNPFDLSDALQAQQARANTNNPVFLPMGQLSAIPQPLHGVVERTEATTTLPSVREQKSYADVRIPSYEGNGWEDEISLRKLQTVRKNTVRTPEAVRLEKPPTRLPVPIKPAPYAGQLRVASKDSPRKTPSSLPKPVGWPCAAPKPGAWPGTSPPPRATTWPGITDQDEFAPPIPPKSPERWNSNRGHVSGSREHDISRIVSKENIRSALGANSRDSSAEDLTLPPSLPMHHVPSRTLSPGGTKLQTFNTNLFPRKAKQKGTPVGEWVGTDGSKYAAGEPYQMDKSGATKRQERQDATANSGKGSTGRYPGVHETGSNHSNRNWV
jgi:hypothetical protein